MIAELGLRRGISPTVSVAAQMWWPTRGFMYHEDLYRNEIMTNDSKDTFRSSDHMFVMLNLHIRYPCILTHVPCNM